MAGLAGRLCGAEPGVDTVSSTRRFLAIVVVVTLVMSFVPGGGLIAQEPPPPSAAYIWRSDASAADGYKSLIQGAGYDVTMLRIEDVPAADLSGFSLVIAGPETGYAYDWGTAEAVRALREAGRPMLGLGYGGACLFEQLGLSINWGNGWIGPETYLYAGDPAHPVFTTPYLLDVPGSRVLDVYTESDHIAEYAPVLSRAAELIGREPADEEHWTLTAEDRCTLWGFTGSPYALTTTGEKLFMNVVNYAASLGAIAGLPDLVVSDLWLVGSHVYYQICNLGDAPADAGHTTQLYRGDSVFSSDVVDVALEPGARVTRSFAGEWDPGTTSTTVRALADATGLITESDEANTYEETWRGDLVPPALATRPLISGIGTTSAQVSWTTDEPCSGRVRYGTRGGLFEAMEPSPEVGTVHSVTLSGLVPATTYRVVIECTDDAGNTARSDELTFKTAATADSRSPMLSLVVTPTAEWPSTLLVDVDDDTGVQMVRFVVDGVEDAVDYAAPFEYLWTPSRFPSGTHTIDVTAIDLAGNEDQASWTTEGLKPIDPTMPVTKIVEPLEDATVSGTIPITALITDSTGIHSVDLMVDAYMRGHLEYPTPYPKGKAALFTYDTTKLTNGKHTIAVLASDETWRPEYGTALDTVSVWVYNAPPAPPPKLTVKSRTVTRVGTTFAVQLQVANIGGTEARNVRIIDPVTAFQPISKVDGTASYTAVLESGASSTAQMEIAPVAPIPAGTTRTFSYRAVPFMTAGSGVTPMIGNPDTTFRWELPTAPGIVYTGYDQAVAFSLTDGTPVHAAHAAAVKSTNSLLVTSPDNLKRFYGVAGAARILSTTAELAAVRNGVLGYLDMPSRFVRDLDLGDALVVGPIGNNDEVIIGDASQKRIYAGRVLETTSTPPGQPPGSPAIHTFRWIEDDLTGTQSFQVGDGLAIGAFRGAAAPSDVVWVDDTTDLIAIVSRNGATRAVQWVPFQSGDTVACGDTTGDGTDEILIVKPSTNQVLTYSVTASMVPTGSWSISLLGSFAWDLETRDCVAVGNVSGDAKDEIVIGDVDFQKIRVLSGSGAILSQFSRSLAEGDGLTIGYADYGPSGPVDTGLIVHASRVSGLTMWLKPTGGSSLAPIQTGFEKGDLLAAGRLTPGDISAFRDAVVVGSLPDNGIELHEIAESGPQTLRDLLAGNKDVFLGVSPPAEPMGAWAKRLHTSFVERGSLTIVGETEIVPAWGNRTFGTVYANSGGVIGHYQMRADLTDYPYASTYGDEIIPELSCGRIIGNSAEEICKPMRASIAVARGEAGHGFDRSDATLVSGFPAGMNGGAASIDFYAEVKNVRNTLVAQGIPMYGWIHTPDHTVKNADGSINQTATASTILSTFFSQTLNSDIVFLAGHGSGGAWDVIRSDDVLATADPFGTADPVVFASSCNTGMYTNAYSFANAMLNRGAAVYLGATIWGLGTHAWISSRFYGTWEQGVSVGDAVREVKQDIAYVTYPGTLDSLAYTWPDKKAQYWSAIYHVLGDPAYGGSGASILSALSGGADALGASPATLAAEPLDGAGTTLLDVSVPDYEVSREAASDVVEIPGGHVLSDTGRPEVPVYVVTREIPKGLAVADVRVTGQSEPLFANDLDLPPLLDAISVDSSDVLPVLPVADPSAAPIDPSARDWWPNASMTWRVIEGLESDTLAITLFPLDYSLQTKVARFVKQWTLAVDVAESPLTIAGAATDAPAYPAGALVTLDVALAADNLPADAVLEATVRDSLGNALGGFPLQSLHLTAPWASSSAVWDSDGAPAGLCIADVVLKDTEGRVLDRTTAEFTLAGADVHADSLSASPEQFTPGATVNASLVVTNESASATDGTAVLLVQDESGAEIASLREEFTGLAASASRTFDFAWDTAGVAHGVYTLRAFVQYDGRSSNELTVDVPTSGPHADAGPDQHVERDSIDGAHVTLDGSGSFDPSGDALTYAWTWSGGSATGVAPAVVLPMGESVVTLTVSDDVSSDTDTVVVQVIDSTGPTVVVTTPVADEAVQDGVTLTAHATDPSGVAAVTFSVHAAALGAGDLTGYEELVASRVAGAPENGTWTAPFDSQELPDGYYTVLALARDAFGNESWSQRVAFSVRNWALVELLPSSARFQPGRTVPVKFSIRVSAAVDPLESFVYNEELEVRIYDIRALTQPLQVSHFGSSATDYRIDQAAEQYVVNFRTLKTPTTYLVQVWRPATGMLLGAFTFMTSK